MLCLYETQEVYERLDVKTKDILVLFGRPSMQSTIQSKQAYLVFGDPKGVLLRPTRPRATR